ncbi:unnamed protein product, partial [Pylaiella littoralis]
SFNRSNTSGWGIVRCQPAGGQFVCRTVCVVYSCLAGSTPPSSCAPLPELFFHCVCVFFFHCTYRGMMSIDETLFYDKRKQFWRTRLLCFVPTAVAPSLVSTDVV